MATIVALGVIISACGSGGGDSPAATPPPSRAPSGQVQSVPTPDAAPDPSPAPAPEAPAPDAAPSASADPKSQADTATKAPSATADRPANSSTRTSGDAEGGLFGAEPEPPSDDEARFEDNTFRDYGYRDFIDAAADPLSTFALDIDTGSYTIARRWIEEGSLPPRESVRPEEYINAFDYDYRAPRQGLDITVDGGPSPFDDSNYLVRVGVQGEIVDDRDRERAALTFVVDTSGSMDRDDRLGLVKKALSILVDELNDDDTVAIVTYDDRSGVVLEPTRVRDRREILDAINDLQPGGSTNLEAGLREGYELANDAFVRNGINRVILASDGVANVGVTDPDELARRIQEDANRGINLVTVGFGMGNFNDVTMEQLADQGDGFYAYVDTEDEADRLFRDELTSTLLTVAKDAKVQVEFDPNIVRSYRLIGFENRGVLDSEFRNDAVDAGELGAGHQVTAIYDIELERGVSIDDRGDIGRVFLRWEDPESGDVIEIDEDIDLRDIDGDWLDTREDFQLATVVAVFAELMRDNPFADGIDIRDLSDEASRLADELNDRNVDDFADLIGRASGLR
jgi:Ca-activated chloride channel family protein